MSDSAAPKTYGIFANPNARKIIAELGKLNADVRLFPPVEIENIILNETSVEILQNLNDFDWLIFTDIFAVDLFLETLAENAIDSFELDNLRVCAVGETVADQLRFSSIHSDVIPANIRMENILSAIADYASAETFENLRILFPNGNNDFGKLAEKLREKGAQVTELPIYKINSTDNSEITKLKTLLTGGAIDEFVFTAPSDFVALKHFFKAADLTEVFREIKISAADTLNIQTAGENNFSPISLFHLAKN